MVVHTAVIDRIFRDLAEPTRRDVMLRVMKEEQSVSELAAQYSMSFAAVQKHVAVLERAGLVGKNTVGRERLVTANPQQLARARAALQQLENLWRHRLEALDQILSE